MGVDQSGSQQLQASVGAPSLGGHSSEFGSNCSTPGMQLSNNCCPPPTQTQTPQQHQITSPFDEAQANRNRSLSHSLNYPLGNFPPPHTPSPASAAVGAYALRSPPETFTPPITLTQQQQQQSHPELPSGPGLWPPAVARHMSLSNVPPHGNSLTFGAFPQSAPYHSVCAFPPSSPRHQIIRLPAFAAPPGAPGFSAPSAVALPGDHQSPASYAVDNVSNNAFVPAAAAVDPIATSHPSPFNHTGLVSNGPVSAAAVAAAAHLAAHSSPPPLGAPPGALPSIHRALHPSLAYTLPAAPQHLPYAQASLGSTDTAIFSPISDHQTQQQQQLQQPHQLWPSTVLARHVSVPSAAATPGLNSGPGPSASQIPMSLNANASVALVAAAAAGAPGPIIYATTASSMFQAQMRPGLQVPVSAMHLAPHDASTGVPNNINVRGPSPATQTQLIPQLDGVDDSFTESTSAPQPQPQTPTRTNATAARATPQPIPIPIPSSSQAAVVQTQSALQQMLEVAPFSRPPPLPAQLTPSAILAAAPTSATNANAYSVPVSASAVDTAVSTPNRANPPHFAFHPSTVFPRPPISVSPAAAMPGSPLNLDVFPPATVAITTPPVLYRTPSGSSPNANVDIMPSPVPVPVPVPVPLSASSAQHLGTVSQPSAFAPRLMPQPHTQQSAYPSTPLEHMSQPQPTPSPSQITPLVLVQQHSPAAAAAAAASVQSRSRPPSVQALTAVQLLEAPRGTGASAARERAASSSSVSQVGAALGPHSAPHSRHASGSGSGVQHAGGTGTPPNSSIAAGLQAPELQVMSKPLSQTQSGSSSLSSLQHLVLPPPPAAGADAPPVSSSVSVAHSKTPSHSGIDLTIIW